MRVKRPLALGVFFGCWFWFLFGVVFGLGLLLFFSPHHFVFPSLSMMTWALRPHGVRTRGKKIMSYFSCTWFEPIARKREASVSHQMHMMSTSFSHRVHPTVHSQ